MKISRNGGFLLLAGAILSGLMLLKATWPQSAMSQALPDEIQIRGVVRDFRMAHPDFNVMASGVDGAGSVQQRLGADGVPASESIVSSNGSNGASTVVDTISKWSFNEADGTIAADNRNVQDGLLTNGPTRVHGRFGKALQFDGVDDFVLVPHDPAYLVDTASLAFWFSTPDTITRQVLVGKDASGHGSGGHLTCFIENGQVQVMLSSATASYFVTSPPGTIVADTWHHVAFSFGADGMFLYVDNQLVDSNPYTGGLGTSSGGTGNVEPWTFGVGKWESSASAALDQFNTVSYGGDDGSRPWSGNWVEISDDGSASTGNVRVQSGYLHIDNSDGGSLPAVTRSVDLSGAATAVLAFDYGGYGTGPTDIFAVEASDNGGVDFVLLEAIPVIEYANGARSYDLQNFIGLTNDVVIRFRDQQGFMASGQHFTLDNVRVGEMSDWSDPLHGEIDEVQIFARSLGNSDFMAVGGFIVDKTRKGKGGRPIAPNLEEVAGACVGSETDASSPVEVGSTTDGAIASSVTFSEWFHDVLGTNLSAAHYITLTDDGAGVWEYLTEAFYPADGQLFGSEGSTHNQFYTYSFTSRFTYSECTDQFFEFRGGDGAWMFIDEHLAIDLGGVGSPTAQYVELDRLELVDGQVYTLRFFYAQRQTGAAVFLLRTNLLLSGYEPLSVTSCFD